MKTQTEILARNNGKIVSWYVLESRSYVIGRAPVCEIRIDVEGIAERHVRLTMRDEEMILEDLGSENGTYVDEVRIEKPTSFLFHQKIRIGQVMLEFVRTDRLLHGSALSLLHQANKYSLGKVLAKGGLGIIREAQDFTINRMVAMKTMLPEKSESPEEDWRFIREAQITGQLEHPNIVPIHDLGISDIGDVFYTMKLVKGSTLQAILDKLKARDAQTLAQMSLNHMLTIFLKVCDGIAYAHSRGVVHRDLKPENVMIGEYGEVLVMDWGIAKILKNHDVAISVPPEKSSALLPLQMTGAAVRTSMSDSVTESGEAVGTPTHMSPEQALGQREKVDERTDVYGLGAILYNILTLNYHVQGHNFQQFISNISEGKITPISHYDQTGNLPHCPGDRIPPALAAIAMKALSFDREDRYPTVQDLQRDIETFLTGFSPSVEKATFLRKLKLFILRHKDAFGVVAVAVAILIAIILAALLELAHERHSNQAKLELLTGEGPRFYADAVAKTAEGNFDRALKDISFAIVLGSQEAEYFNLRGNIYQALLRVQEAKNDYAKALELNKNHRLAAENLRLCEKILRDNADKNELSAASIRELIDAMQRQRRFAEASAVLAQLEKQPQPSPSN